VVPKEKGVKAGTGPSQDVPHTSLATTASAAGVATSITARDVDEVEGGTRAGTGTGTGGMARTTHRTDSTYALDGDLTVTGSTVDDTQSLVSSIALSLSAVPVSVSTSVSPARPIVKDGKDKGKSKVMRGGGLGPGNGSPVRVGAAVQPSLPGPSPVPTSVIADQRTACTADVLVTPTKRKGAGSGNGYAATSSSASKGTGTSAAGGGVVPRTGGAERKVAGAPLSPNPSTRRISPVPPQTRVPLTRTTHTQGTVAATGGVSVARQTAPPATANAASHTEGLRTPPRLKPAEREKERETVPLTLAVPSSAANPFQAIALALPAAATAAAAIGTTQQGEPHLSLQVPAPNSPPIPAPVGAQSPALSPRRDSTFLRALMGAINGTPSPRAKSPVPAPMPLNPAPFSSSPRPAAATSKSQLEGSMVMDGTTGARKGEEEERENIPGRENAPLTPPPTEGGGSRSPVRVHAPLDAAVSPFAAITAKRN
jgi:hypothetical protein